MSAWGARGGVEVCGDVCAGMVGGIECERCVGVEDGIKRHCKQEIREKGVK